MAPAELDPVSAELVGGLQHQLPALPAQVLDQVHVLAGGVGGGTVDHGAPPGDVLADRGPLGRVEAELLARIGEQGEERLVPEQLAAERVDQVDLDLVGAQAPGVEAELLGIGDRGLDAARGVEVAIELRARAGDRVAGPGEDARDRVADRGRWRQATRPAGPTERPIRGGLPCARRAGGPALRCRCPGGT